jgi:zinc protease
MGRRFNICFVALLVISSLFLIVPQFSAQRAPQARIAAAERITVPAIPFEKYKLKNGLEVILSEDHRLPLVAVYVLYHVGPANERPGRTGFAHLFEHFMFDGSLHVGEKAHFKTLEAAGARQINGTTDLDHTKYFETVPSNELEKALWLESDRMGFLLETITGPKLANQRDVVRNERRQKIENEPYGLADEAVFHLLFPKDHPYHADVIGSHADIEAARLNDVREFLKQYYVPNNASLAIVGDIDKAHTKEMVDKYFGALPAGDPVPKIEAQTPVITSERRAVVTDKVELPRVYLAWITDPVFKPGDAEEQLLAKILAGSGKSGRLYQRLVYDKQIAQDVSAEQTSLGLASVFTIQVTAKPGIKPEQLETAIDEVLAELEKNGPTQDELNQAKTITEARILRRLETVGGEGGVAGRLSRYNHYLKNPGFLSQDIERYENVTLQSVQSVAQKKFTKNSRVVVYCVRGPKVIDDVPRAKDENEASTVALDERRVAFDRTQEWRRAVPPRGASSKISLPVPQRFKLSNGLTVLLDERHNLPVITADLFFLSGSTANPPDKPGLAAFTAAMLQEGTRKRSAMEIAADTERLGAEVADSSTSDWSGILMRCLKQNLDGAFDLLSDMALNPAFAPEDIERVRNERLTLLRQERDNSPTVALKVFYRSVYGDKHPYGHMELGTETSLKQITAEDVRQFWESGYVPSNAVLTITGDITKAEARATVEKYFGLWKGKGKRIAPPEFEGPLKRRVVIVDKPGAPQTALLVGGVGVPRSSPDYVPIEVVNTVLGGLISARLNMNLREKHGYTYGIFSQFVYRRGAGPFFARTSVRADVTAPALQEVLNELNGLRSNPISANELKAAKDSMSRSLPGLFETTQQTSRSLADLFLYSFPLDYFSDLPEHINSVNLTQAQNAADKYVQPDDMIIVAVGDRSKIEPALRKLNLGQIEIRDRDGNLITGN